MKYHKLLYQGKGTIYQNEQRYSECQLVSALNAAYCLGEKLIHPDSEEYERLVDLTGARHGNCINVYKAYEYLRLNYIDVKPEWGSIWFAMEMNLPISVGVISAVNNFHSTVIIEMKHNNKTGDYELRVPNLKRHTDKQMWVNWPKYKKIIHVIENIGPEYGFFRIFYKGSDEALLKFTFNLKGE